MTRADFQYGFRIVGDCRGDRRIVDWHRAFNAYAECDDAAECDQEAYLSAFMFGADFRDLLTVSGSPRGFEGPTWSPWLWIDIDRPDIDAATADCRKLAGEILNRFAFAGDDLLIFYSGSKGYHVGLPTTLWGPSPDVRFHAYCRQFALTLAEIAAVAIDTGVYDRVRAFRAPNSRHPKSGRYKRFIGLDGLMTWTPGSIQDKAAEPAPFAVPVVASRCSQSSSGWLAAVQAVDKKNEAIHERRQNGTPATLNRETLRFIREGATTGDRHRLLFSAAANLAEFSCSHDLASALLSESALDSGLSPSEVQRQIDCGLKHFGSKAP